LFDHKDNGFRVIVGKGREWYNIIRHRRGMMDALREMVIREFFVTIGR
jgi:hypothetical protein